MEMEILRELHVEQGSLERQESDSQGIAAPDQGSDPSQAQAGIRQARKAERMHVTRLECICREPGESPRGKKCVGMEGLLQEGKDLMKEKPQRDALNAGLISAAQHVEHYEMAAHGTCRT